MQRSLYAFSAILILGHASAQVMIYGVADPAAAALTHLQGANVTLSNAFSQTIDPQQVAVFSDSTASIGLDSGLVLSTGIAYGLLGPNNIPNMTFGGGFGGFDPDLMGMSTLYPGSMYDPGIIQLDLVPLGDTLEITYVFGSEEYDEYVCSDKDDRMGLFLSGPGLAGAFTNGGINMALLPASGLPVTVNTLNRGQNGAEGNMALCYMNPTWLADTIYYINNDLGMGTQLDGYSVVLTAQAVVQPGMTYHLKIALADVNDGNFDSAIFLPEGAIRCSDISTSLHHQAGDDPVDIWYSEGDGSIHVRTCSLIDEPLQLEIFDASGRLIQWTLAGSRGAERIARLDQHPSGLAIVRASWPSGVVTRRLFVR